uniref:Uncharacterized protein n=1 Tax=Anguilla anguilla TaxID=7936 RepID=A0A0E9TNW4_ANGAN
MEGRIANVQTSGKYRQRLFTVT